MSSVLFPQGWDPDLHGEGVVVTASCVKMLTRWHGWSPSGGEVIAGMCRGEAGGRPWGLVSEYHTASACWSAGSWAEEKWHKGIRKRSPFRWLWWCLSGALYWQRYCTIGEGRSGSNLELQAHKGCMLSFESLAYKVAFAWQLGSWLLDGFLPFLEWRRVAVCRLLYTWLMLNTWFPSGNLEFGYVPGRGCLYDPSPTPQELWVLSLWWASWVGNISYVLSQHFVGKIKCILCDPSGRGPFQGCTWFPQDFTSCAFSPVDCALPHFAIVNSNRVRWYAESVSPPHRSSSLGWPWGPLTH